MTCEKCKNETSISRNDLSDGVVVSECCYALVLLNGIEYTIWDKEEEDQINYAEALMDLQRENALLGIKL